MPAPTNHPDWATDATNNVEPPSGKVAVGWVAGEEPPASWFNWWQNLVGLWIRWFDTNVNDLLGRTRAVEVNYLTIAALNTVKRTLGGGATDDLRGAAFGKAADGSRYWVVVGGNGRIQRSTNDGVTWTNASGSPFAAGNFRGVAYGNGVFVAVGATGTGGASDLPIIFSSPDGGSSWTQRTPGGSPTAGEYLNAVTYGGGQFVAVGARGMIQTSPDGITWTRQTIANTTDTLQAIAYRSGTFFMVGGSVTPRGVVHRSTDGITWTRVLLPASVGLVTAVAAGTSHLVVAGDVAGGSTDCEIYASPDGIAWTLEKRVPSTEVTGATYLNGLFVLCSQATQNPAVGAVDTLIAGVVGNKWVQAPGPNAGNSLYGFATDGYKLVLVGALGGVYTSLQMPWYVELGP
jgi:hypothetical protein